jgi:hypothetical protein
VLLRPGQIIEYSEGEEEEGGNKKEAKDREKKEWRWQRRTLPPRYQGSTIRARELNCRVRDGSGCTLTALATNSTFVLLVCALRFFSC